MTANNLTSWPLNIIGHVHSPYKEKFSVPRQPNLVTCAKGYIRLDGAYANLDLFDGIDHFSHIWLIFVFHQTAKQGWKAKVRPQRLGGNKKMGVLATRSTFRPNPIGLSCVQFCHVERVNKHQTRLHVQGIDLVDGTPIVDIKPYVPYVDRIEQATSTFAQQPPDALLDVVFAPALVSKLSVCEAEYPGFESFVAQVLAQDPRPVYKRSKDDDKTYGVTLAKWNIRFVVNAHICTVVEIEPV
ncbi:hypothetical protein DS2_01485 [Catenovulum agarivorans DS-2]|uniref:TsaA-like domain-containing protein n=1 Tax=Catenovulum agarivorans DS-2 TaxID=1328313 RepID=W7QTJ8_9ALTE|nr:tRNA (N6-threonylcarbamoyladenosine(37)-N6)-methyltransferase TrmO [Catenovulum agarivorans]EWH12352.1 hypothetical protein DS2_01485 [Catenovulum agarivorans DS-2]